MARVMQFLGLTVLLCCFAACLSVPAGPGPGSVPASGTPAPAATQAPAGRNAAGAGGGEQIRERMRLAADAVTRGAMAEAIRNWVSVISAGRGSTEPDVGKLVADAQHELAKVAATLTLEASQEWLDAGGTQKEGVSLTGNGLLLPPPSVVLTRAELGGKVVLGEIDIEFLAPGGASLGLVQSGFLGEAKLEPRMKVSEGATFELTARPVVREGSFVYIFPQVQCRFRYRASRPMVVTAAWETGPAGANATLASPQAVFPVLDALGLSTKIGSFSAQEPFMALFGGTSTQLPREWDAAKASHAFLVRTEVEAPQQVSYGGRTYNIYTANTKATGRFIQLSNGKALFAVTAAVAGQGGTPEVAVSDAYVRAAVAIAKALEAKQGDIRQIMEK